MWDWGWNWRRFIIGVVYNTCGSRSGGNRELHIFLGFAHVEYHWVTDMPQECL